MAECPTSVWKVIGSTPVVRSQNFFLSSLCHWLNNIFLNFKLFNYRDCKILYTPRRTVNQRPFLFKVSLMQSTEEEALPPPELQSRITDILTASPNIAEAVSFVCSRKVSACQFPCLWTVNLESQTMEGNKWEIDLQLNLSTLVTLGRINWPLYRGGRCREVSIGVYGSVHGHNNIIRKWMIDCCPAVNWMRPKLY